MQGKKLKKGLEVELERTIYIPKHKPNLNKPVSSFHLLLFPYAVI